MASSFFSGPLAGEDWPFAIFCGVLLALPFGYLALEGPTSLRPWIVALLVTACFWGLIIVMIFLSARDQSGVNFGIVPIALASPVVVTIAAWLALDNRGPGDDSHH